MKTIALIAAVANNRVIGKMVLYPGIVQKTCAISGA